MIGLKKFYIKKENITKIMKESKNKISFPSDILLKWDNVISLSHAHNHIQYICICN